MYQRAKMKQEVKQIIRQTRPKPMWLTLLYLVIVSVGGSIIQSVLGVVTGIGSLGLSFSPDTFMTSDPELIMNQLMEQLVGQLLANPLLLPGLIAGGTLVAVVSYLWQSLMTASYAGYSLSLVRRENPSFKELFSAFPKFGKVILSRILVGVFTTLWTLLFGVIFAVLAVVAGLLIALEGVGVLIGVLLLIVSYVAFLVAILWITLRFAMVDYLVMDQGIFGLEALTMSKKMMKGNKRRLFVLQLSFIGWYLLIIAIVYAGLLLGLLGMLLGAPGTPGFVVGLIVGELFAFLIVTVIVTLLNAWLTPYISGSTAKLYEFIKGQRTDLFPNQFDTYTGDSFGYPNYPKLDE